MHWESTSILKKADPDATLACQKKVKLSSLECLPIITPTENIESDSPAMIVLK
jgi:hypothetical protein